MVLTAPYAQVLLACDKYSPRCIGNSRMVHAVLTRYLQSSAVFCSLRQFPVRPASHLQGQPLIRSYQKNFPTRDTCSPCQSIPGALSGTAVRPVRTQRWTDSTLGNTGRTTTLCPSQGTSMFGCTSLVHC